MEEGGALGFHRTPSAESRRTDVDSRLAHSPPASRSGSIMGARPRPAPAHPHSATSTLRTSSAHNKSTGEEGSHHKGAKTKKKIPPWVTKLDAS